MPEVLQREPEAVESVAAETVLDILSDDYAQRIVEVLASQPAPAAMIVEQLDASRPTVYRRLNSLEAAGIVESTVALDPDGHHRKRFHLIVENIGFQLDTDGIRLMLSG
jgi:predicted transcriptional regulator